MNQTSFPEIPLVVDSGRELIDQQFTEELVNTASQKAWRELSGLVNRLPWGAVAKHGVVDAIDARDLLVRGCAAVEAELRRQASGYSSMRWFWMLRRVPRRVFEASLSTTRGYDWTLGHVIAASSIKHEEVAFTDGILRYPLQGAVFRRLAEFCEGVRCLSDLHRALRWAGKGAGFVSRADENPKEIASADLKEAVELYDSRRGDAPFSRTGSLFVNLKGNQPPENSILLLRPTQEFEVPLPGAAVYPDGDFRVRANFLPMLVDIRELEMFTADAEQSGTTPWQSECWALIAILRMAIIYTYRHGAGLQSLLQNGYLAGTESILESLLSEMIQIDEMTARCSRSCGATSGNALLALSTGAGRSWPLLAGPIVYVEGGAICLDLWAATERLDSLLQHIKEEGPIANVRAAHFELATQGLIDSTKWRPGPQVKMLRGVTLTRGARQITDIDAIGQNGDTLLLVSCKSVIYTAEHDAGDHRAVRNTGNHAISAANKWIQKCADIMLAPGDNFDFTSFTRAIGVVCTPYPVFVPIGVATEEVDPGLRRVSSVNELKDWVSNPSKHLLWPALH